MNFEVPTRCKETQKYYLQEGCVYKPHVALRFGGVCFRGFLFFRCWLLGFLAFRPGCWFMWLLVAFWLCLFASAAFPVGFWLWIPASSASPVPLRQVFCIFLLMYVCMYVCLHVCTSSNIIGKPLPPLLFISITPFLKSLHPRLSRHFFEHQWGGRRPPHPPAAFWKSAANTKNTPI